MIRCIKNIDISFSISIYHIVSSKKYRIFRYIAIFKNISMYRDLFDNIAIFSTDFSLNCMTRKKDYEWGKLMVSSFNYSRNITSPRDIFLLSKWSILPCSMFTFCFYARIRFTYLLFYNIDIEIFSKVLYRYRIKIEVLMSSHHYSAVMSRLF